MKGWKGNRKRVSYFVLRGAYPTKTRNAKHAIRNTEHVLRAGHRIRGLANSFATHFAICPDFLHHKRHEAADPEAADEFAAVFVLDDRKAFEPIFADGSGGEGAIVIHGHGDRAFGHEVFDCGVFARAKRAATEQIRDSDDAIEGLAICGDVEEFVTVLDKGMADIQQGSLGLE